MVVKSILSIGLVALACSMPLHAKETPAQTAARDAENRAFVLKHYPPRARAAGEQGRVFFTMTLDRDGRLRSCEVTKSSGYPRLDDETCELMVAHGVFKPVRDESGLVKNPVHHGAINWTLPEGAATMPAPQQLASAAKSDKLICRRQLKTGSTLMTERRCLTAREWNMAYDYGRSETKRMQDSAPSLIR